MVRGRESFVDGMGIGMHFRHCWLGDRKGIRPVIDKKLS